MRGRSRGGERRTRPVEPKVSLVTASMKIGDFAGSVTSGARVGSDDAGRLKEYKIRAQSDRADASIYTCAHSFEVVAA
jgi:hypothetical protein